MKERKIQNGEEAVKYCYLDVTPDSLNIPMGVERDHGGVGRGKAGGGNDQNTLSMCREFSKNKFKILFN